MYLFMPVSYLLSAAWLFAGHLQLAVCPIVAIANFSQDLVSELLDLLRSPFLDPKERCQGYVRETLVHAQVEPSADINIVRVDGAAIDKHREDILIDIYEPRVGQ